MSGATLPEAIPVVLAGGSGRRLWPRSTPDAPKQFLSGPDGCASSYQDALGRAEALAGSPLVVGGAPSMRTLLEEQASGCRLLGGLLQEHPQGTASAVCASALFVRALGAHEKRRLVILPSDHRIERPEALRRAVRRADDWARERPDGIAVIGCPPRPGLAGTGFGHIVAEARDGEAHARRVAEFVEKPGPDVRARLARAGALWCSGIYLARIDAWLNAYASLAPELLAAVRTAIAGCTTNGVWGLIGEMYLGRSADALGDSLDRILTARHAQVAVFEADMDWRDVGSWVAMGNQWGRDGKGNAASGAAALERTSRVTAWTHGPRLRIVGVSDLIVAAGPDEVLVTHAHEEVRPNASQAHPTRQAMRPWGGYEILDAGPGHLVKRLWVLPGHRLSVQRHRLRDEHWVVAYGHASAHVGAASFSLRPGQSVRVPRMAWHRLSNPGDAVLQIIETQTGERLSEDDIERLTDDHRRPAGSGVAPSHKSPSKEASPRSGPIIPPKRQPKLQKERGMDAKTRELCLETLRETRAKAGKVLDLMTETLVPDMADFRRQWSRAASSVADGLRPLADHRLRGAAAAMTLAAMTPAPMGARADTTLVRVTTAKPVDRLVSETVCVRDRRFAHTPKDSAGRNWVRRIVGAVVGVAAADAAGGADVGKAAGGLLGAIVEDNMQEGRCRQRHAEQDYMRGGDDGCPSPLGEEARTRGSITEGTQVWFEYGGQRYKLIQPRRNIASSDVMEVDSSQLNVPRRVKDNPCVPVNCDASAKPTEIRVERSLMDPALACVRTKASAWPEISRHIQAAGVSSEAEAFQAEEDSWVETLMPHTDWRAVEQSLAAEGGVPHLIEYDGGDDEPGCPRPRAAVVGLTAGQGQDAQPCCAAGSSCADAAPG